MVENTRAPAKTAITRSPLSRVRSLRFFLGWSLVGGVCSIGLFLSFWRDESERVVASTPPCFCCGITIRLSFEPILFTFDKILGSRHEEYLREVIARTTTPRL